MKRISCITICLLLFTGSYSFGQTKATGSKKSEDWSVNNPPGPFHEVKFQATEGTWMNLDVSPDGTEIVFDLLGDLYRIPVTGGNAQILRQNRAIEVQPRYSQDGKKILFTSDAGGGDNIWIMNRDGSDARQITKESFRLINNACWLPGGQYFVARKHFTSYRSLGAGELWMYHISGGDGLQLTPRKNDQQDLNEPWSSPDGRYIYYSEDMYPGGFFQYNKDPNNQIFVIKRFDRERGISEVVTGGPGGAVRPQLSHDGKTLAFVRRVRTKSVLYLRKLDTGEEWPVYDQLSKDQQEAWTIFGSYTGFNWMPDDQSIVIWSQGKIWKIPVNNNTPAQQIPFTCAVKKELTETVRFRQQLNPDSFKVNVIRQSITSPDGKMLVFNALGYLWKKELPNGKPQRLTNDADPESEPSFSADGKQLIYVTWNDTSAGSIKTLSLAPGALPLTVSREKAIYRSPVFSPDGKSIAYSKEEGDLVLGVTYNVQPGIYLMNLEDGHSVFVTDKGEQPRFSKSGTRIYYQQNRSSLGSCKLDGSDERTLVKSTYGSQFVVAPNEEWIAFVDLHKVYISSFPQTGKTLDISAGTTAYPVKQVSRDAGYNLHWSGSGEQLHYVLGDQYYSIPLKDRFGFITGKTVDSFVMPEQGQSIGLVVLAEKPRQLMALQHARIISMKGTEVIENGTILIRDNQILELGPDASVTIPDNAIKMDCSGKTILPGFIDAHAHVNHFRNGLTPQKHWPYYTNLAYGVTTTHDPSANSEMVFAQSELVKAGLMVGPRVFSTGTVLYGADGDFKAVVNNLEDARSALRRTQAFGAFSVKSYNQPRREQRQMIIEAARELHMNVVPEGGSFFYHNLSMILDGHTTIEHNIPVAPLFDDMIQLWKQSGTAYTPTLIVCYGAPNGEYYWYQHTNVWENEKLLRFTPRAIIDTRSRFRTMLPEEEYENGHIIVSKSCKKLMDAGVKVNMGAHGQIQGIGAHWEIWMMQQGGMSNFQALQTATINPAVSLGLDQWVGSLEKGKLADLIILDKNPLDNIRNTESIRYTMINGHLYDANTMNETGSYSKKRSPFFWELRKNSQAFPWHEATRSYDNGHLDD